MIIYKCTFSNNKVYIGQTTRNIDERIREHKTNSKNKKDNKYNYPFYKAIRETGWDNLIWEIIDEVKTLKELDEREIYWIDFYNSCMLSNNSRGYNRNFGGTGTHFHTKESRNKISKKASGENASRAILKNEDIFEIIRLSKTKIKRIDIARMFHVTGATISRIVSGKRWSSLTEI